MDERQFKASLLPVMVIIFCILIVGVAAGILALNRQREAVTVRRVPQDYATIQAAISAAQPGDVVEVQAGTYTENLILDRPVTLSAAVFDAANPANNRTFLDAAGGAAITIPPNLLQMPIVRGFVIRGNNVGIQASSPSIIEFNTFLASSDQVNYQWGAGGANRNNVYFKAGDDAIHVDSLDRPLLIENNRILYATDDGIEVNLQDKPSPPSLVDINIWNNMIIGSLEDGVQVIDFPGDPQNTNRRLVILGNLIANSQKAGIGLMANANTVEDFSGADIIEPIRVFNNTFYGNNYGISGGDDLVAFNNIIANSQGRGVWRVQGPPGANSMVAYTLFFNNTMDADQATLGPGLITGQDPLFSAAPNPGPDGSWQTIDDDFSGLLLQGASPAVDRGVTQYAAVSGELIPASPLTGFIGAAPDLGWREYGSPIVLTPTATPIASPTLVISPTAPIATLTQTFTVLPPSPTIVTVTPLPTSTQAPPTASLPTATATLPLLPTNTIAPTAGKLSIVSVTPNSVPANAVVNVTVSGSAFVNGAILSFEGAEGKAPEVTGSQVVNANTIVATVNTAAPGGATLVWDVRVTNPDNSSAVLQDAFTVTVP